MKPARAASRQRSGFRATIVAAFATLAVLGLAAQPRAQDAAIIAGAARIQPALARHGMVSSQEARATRIGVDILAAGGNAVDAAVAVGFALAVSLPRAGNLGGGGFMLVHRAAQGSRAAETIAIDYRETAPAAASRDMFLAPDGQADPAKSRDSALAVGVPGTVAGLALAHARYGSGRFSLADLIAPAIALAQVGIPVDDDLADSLPHAAVRLLRWPAAARIFLRPDGAALGRGDVLRQPDLAATLSAIARDGPQAFYEGQVAAALVTAVQNAGGILTRDDLANYRAVVRAPVRGSYRGHDILAMPPPSSGGAHLIQILNILEGYDMGASRAGSAATLHLMIEAMKRAYADRADHLGDPDHVRVPLAGLISKRYAAALRSGIDPERATPAQAIRSGDPTRYESDQTTHFSVIDRDGNAVANTTTLNFSYGLGMVADGTGVLLNNELDDFAAKPGAPNAYGLVGGAANAPGPGRRPLSSMTPTIVLKDGGVLLVTGSPGGSRIITTVLQVILNVVDYRMNIAEAVLSPRIHHQWFPDVVAAESGVSPDTLALLAARGHAVKVGPTSGSANSIMVTPQGLAGASDTRQRGTLAAGH
jgi:gamma-glutamyltranspeptidase/glutathione hydrolase